MRLINRSCAGLALLAATACNDTATDTLEPNGVWSLSSIWSGQIVIAENIDAPQWPSDPVTVVSAEVKGDSLELVVNYGGGCRAQSFLLLSDAAWMESFPLQVGVRVARDAQGDNCKALLSRMLRFDLSPLKAAYNAAYQSTTGIIRLNIRGFESVTYSW
ncbi:MAG TPA: hypothetical protein VFD64_20885 [Gemmatimonadaceae bacterium]|nr:hypothetical protein [Gemmatimonadaceae bacterium]